MPFLPSTGSMATSTRICAVIWIIAQCPARRAADSSSGRNGGLPLDAHFAAAGGFELDQALGSGSWSRRDQFHESRLTRRSASPTTGGDEKAFQLAGIQVQLLGSPVYAFLARGINSGRPQLIRDRRFPCTAASPSLELRSYGLNAAALSDLRSHRPLVLRTEKRQ